MPKQIDFDKAAGKTIKRIITSGNPRDRLIAFDDGTFSIIGAEQCWDEINLDTDGYYCFEYWPFDEIAAAFGLEYAEREQAEYEKRTAEDENRRQRERIASLKAELERLEGKPA